MFSWDLYLVQGIMSLQIAISVRLMSARDTTTSWSLVTCSRRFRSVHVSVYSAF